MEGIVKWFHAKKGYGFITGSDGSDYFTGYVDIISNADFKTLNEGEEVIFEPIKQDRTEFKYDRAIKVKSTNANATTEEVGDAYSAN